MLPKCPELINDCPGAHFYVGRGHLRPSLPLPAEGSGMDGQATGAFPKRMSTGLFCHPGFGRRGTAVFWQMRWVSARLSRFGAVLETAHCVGDVFLLAGVCFVEWCTQSGCNPCAAADASDIAGSASLAAPGCTWQAELRAKLSFGLGSGGAARRGCGVQVGLCALLGMPKAS